MEINQLCSQHQKQKINWVCLEKKCAQRVMCSTCAVKIHERSHKLEELSNLMENGVLITYMSNQRNISAGLKYLYNGETEMSLEEKSNNNENYLIVVERNLKGVQKKIDTYKKELQEKQVEIKKNNEEERNKILNELNELNEEMKSTEDVGQYVEQAFTKIQGFVNHKEHELKHNKESEIVMKKISLLNLMKDNFLRMIKAYFSNQFTIEFCKLFDMQMETLNQKEVQDVNGFLDYVDSKWKQDYKNIQQSIEKFIQKLHEGLKYIIQLPLQEDKPLKQQIVIPPFASPARNQMNFQQPHFVPQSPFNQAPLNFQVQQQIPMTGQRAPHSLITGPIENENDYFARSQIIYEEPQTRNLEFIIILMNQTQSKKKIAIDDFIKIQELGYGAYSKVFSCQKKEDVQQGNSNQSPVYAIKIIDKTHMKMNKKQHHAYIEKEMLQYLKHEGVVKLHQTFQDKNNLYFVIELAPDCLSEFLKLNSHTKLSHQIIQFYVAEMISILEHIHSLGIVHRDIKPENFLITNEKHLKLIDFGTAVIYDSTKVQPKVQEVIQNSRNDFVEKERKRQNSFVGTNAYLTPEMIDDQPVGPGTDLWAVGVILYKMYSGTIPFKSNDEEELYLKIKEEEITFPQSIPLQAQDLIRLFLAKDINKRLVDYKLIKDHYYFSNIDFTKIWEQNPPHHLQQRDQRKSKTFMQDAVPQIIYQELVEKDSGVIISYYTPRLLTLSSVNDVPQIYYTNPKLNNKLTQIHVTQTLKFQQLKQDKFVIIDDQSKKFIFKSKNAKQWIVAIGDAMKQWLK